MILSGISAEIKNNQKLASKNTAKVDNDFLAVLLAKKTASHKQNTPSNLAPLITLAKVPTAEELEKKRLIEKNFSINLSSIKASYVNSASKKKEKAEISSRIVTLPDGRRLLLITIIEVNGHTINLSMTLSSNSPEKNGIIEEIAEKNPNQSFFNPEEDSIAENDALIHSGMALDMF